MKIVFLVLFFFFTLWAKEGEIYLVKIAPDIPYIYVDHKGVKVKVMRIQDTAHLLTDDYTKTSRPCPPFCIHPIKISQDIKTVSTLEVVKFMRDKVNKGKGLIIDARLPSWYNLETIPSAINIPFVFFENNPPKEKVEKLLLLLGAKKKKDGSLDFSQAKELLLFCNGLWCDQSPRFIKHILAYGYPAKKILYYRNGMQGWKLLGLTTVVEKGRFINTKKGKDKK